MKTINVDAILYLLAFVSFVMAAIGVSSKVNLMALGLALLTLSLLV